MTFVPVIAKPCPEPELKVNLTYNFISLGLLKSCYGGYYQNTMVTYSCMDNPNMFAHKTLVCENEGSWRELGSTTPWPT
jgi:hypothetical protein